MLPRLRPGSIQYKVCTSAVTFRLGRARGRARRRHRCLWRQRRDRTAAAAAAAASGGVTCNPCTSFS